MRCLTMQSAQLDQTGVCAYRKNWHRRSVAPAHVRPDLPTAPAYPAEVAGDPNAGTPAPRIACATSSSTSASKRSSPPRSNAIASRTPSRRSSRPRALSHSRREPSADHGRPRGCVDRPRRGRDDQSLIDRCRRLPVRSRFLGPRAQSVRRARAEYLATVEG
jgi:hypothetical protein